MVPTDVAVVADVIHREDGDRRGLGGAEPTLGSEDLVGDASGGDGFLDGVFALFGAKFPKLEFGVGFDGGKHLEKSGVPIGQLN